MQLSNKTLFAGVKKAKYLALPLVVVLAGAVGVANVANVTAAGTVGGAIDSIITTWLPSALFALSAYMLIKIIGAKIEQKPWTGYAMIAVFAVAVASSIITNATNILTSVPFLG